MQTNDLEKQIAELAKTFARGVLGTLQGARMADIVAIAEDRAKPATRGSAPKPGPTGRVRRTQESISAMATEIVKLVRKNGKGMRADEIREALGCQAKDLPLPLAEALSKGTLKKKGERRGTTYFVGKA